MRTLTSGLVLFLAAGAVAIAHHGLTAFDQTNTLTLKGTVTAFHFVNPHPYLLIEVRSGTAAQLRYEMFGPRRRFAVAPRRRLLLTRAPVCQ